MSQASNNHKPLDEAYFYDSVGTTLRKRRQQLQLTIEQVNRQTKIRRSYLIAIENNSWAKLPHTIHILGFIRQYANLLGLDSQVAATKYLLERGPLGQLPSNRRRRLKPPIVGTRIAARSGIGLLIVSLLAYIGWQVSILAAPPPLDILVPASDLQVNEATINVEGETNPSASVSVNGAAVLVDESGRFTTSVSLKEGLNVITIEARNRAGKVAKTERTVLLVDSTSD